MLSRTLATATGHTVAITGANRGDDLGDIPAVAGYIAYDSEGVFLQLTGLWEQDEREYTYLLWSPFVPDSYTLLVFEAIRLTTIGSSALVLASVSATSLL